MLESPAVNEVIWEDPVSAEVSQFDPDFSPKDDVGIEDEDQLIIREIHANLKKAEDHLTNWIQEARVNFDYFAGVQWSQEDIQKLREEKRPAIVFNRIPRVINAIAGLEIESRQEVVYTARQEGDAIASEVLTGAADFVRDDCDAEDEESQAFKDCLMCGMGWTETRLDFEEEADGKIMIERVDPLDMLWDVTAKKRNLSDAGWIARKKIFTRKQFHAMWPEAADDMLNGGMDPKGLQPHDRTLAPWYRVDQSGNDHRLRNQIKVIQYQKWVRVKFYRVQDLDGDIIELDRDEFIKMKSKIKAMGFKYIEQTRKVFKQYFIAGQQMLEKGNCPVNMFTFRCITGMLDHNRNYWNGMIHLMRDPQMWANKWLSQTLYIFNSNAKGGYFAESGAFKDPRQAERTLATSSITYLNEGGLQQIQKKEAPAFPQGLDALLQYAIGSVSELVGVNLESLGMANREQSGVLETERKRTTITIVADFFDALRRYRKEQGRVLADFIVSYIADGRLVRIAGQGLGKYVPLVKDQMDFTYDIVVDDSPTSPNQKERIFATVIQLLPSLMQAGIPIPPEILEYAPLPANLIKDWQDLINQPNPDQESEKMKEQLRLTLAELEAQKQQQAIKNQQADELNTQSQTALNLAKAVREVELSDQEQQNNALQNGLQMLRSINNERSSGQLFNR